MEIAGGVWSTRKSLAAGLVGGFSVLPPYAFQADAAPLKSTERACQWYCVPTVRPPTVTVAVVPGFTNALSKKSTPKVAMVAGLVKATPTGRTSTWSLYLSPSASFDRPLRTTVVSFVAPPVAITVVPLERYCVRLAPGAEGASLLMRTIQKSEAPRRVGCTAPPVTGKSAEF